MNKMPLEVQMELSGFLNSPRILMQIKVPINARILLAKLLTLKGFSLDPSAVANSLGMTVLTANRNFRRLHALGLVGLEYDRILIYPQAIYERYLNCNPAK